MSQSESLFVVSEAWRSAFSGAAAGVLVMRGVTNPERHDGLELRKQELVARLRNRYAGFDREALAALPVIRAYSTYTRRFKKTYHVALQLESLVLKGKPIPGIAALVEAMFMSELEDLLLTAGHDLDTLAGVVTLNVSSGSERYTLLRGEEQQLKAGDMYMADEMGVISSVIYGPDQRTQITPATRNVLFAVYAPPGIGEQAVREHLDRIEANVRCIAPDSIVTLSEAVTASVL